MNKTDHKKAGKNVSRIEDIRAYLSHKEKDFSLEDFTKESLQRIYAAMDRAKADEESDQHA